MWWPGGATFWTARFLALSAVSLPAKAENCSLPSHRSLHLRGRLRPPSWSMMATRDLGNPGGFIPASVERGLHHSKYGPTLFAGLGGLLEKYRGEVG